jgi:hypothetical protein
MRIRPWLVLVAFALPLAACGGTKEEPKGEPDRVTVDHILIGVENLQPGARSAGSRSAPAAKAFAYDLFAKLKAGADWAEAKSKNTDDPPPGGPYTMTNFGIRPGPGEYPRKDMATSFGNVSFKLAVGEMGMADYDPKNSPFGYHIIKRLK